MCTKRKRRPHNEHSKHSMPKGCRFYPEKSLLADVFSPFWAYVKLWFPTNCEAWLSQDSIPWLPLINFLLSRPPFQVFNLGMLFVVKPPFRIFNLTSHFSFFIFLFFHFLWFKLPFRVFTLNLFLFLFLPKPPFRVFNSDKSFFWWPQA